MREFVKVADILGELYPSLSICSEDGSPVKVLQWQSYGEVVAGENGVTIADAVFLEKADSFLDLAKATNSDLVMTPEYSFPYNVIEKIISDNNFWPQKGKLWCLGTQGESLVEFREKVRMWGTNKNINILMDAVNDLHESIFVSPLLYFFIQGDGKLCVIPQLKTGQMNDTHNIFEGINLALGTKIFVFNDGKATSYQNAFFSLICADVLHTGIDDVIRNIQEESVIIFHPQMNSNPRHERFKSFRNGLLDNGMRKVRILTLNWAADTSVRGMPSIKFIKPWSAFYKNSQKDTSDGSLAEAIRKNHIKGTAYTKDNHIDIWYSHRFEHCKLMLISKGFNGQSSYAAINRDEPDTQGCFMFVNKKWEFIGNLCSSNAIQLFRQNGLENNFQYPICTVSDKCDKCVGSDFFFGSFFGHFDSGELESKYEVVERFIVGSDKESDEKRNEKLDIILTVKELLDEGKLPDALSYLNNNYKFEISDEFLENRKEIYNVRPIKPSFENPEVLVVVCKSSHQSDISELIHKLQSRLSKKYRNQILLYYRTPGRGYIYYDKHLINSEITSSDFTEKEASIKRSGHSIKGK